MAPIAAVMGGGVALLVVALLVNLVAGHEARADGEFVEDRVLAFAELRRHIGRALAELGRQGCIGGVIVQDNGGGCVMREATLGAHS